MIKQIFASIASAMCVACAVTTFAALAHAQGPTFFTDFESGVPPEFSGVISPTGTQGYTAFGFGNTFLRNTTASSTVLTLPNLPAHAVLRISFDLAIIDSWDGSTLIGGAAPSDFFNVRVDGATVFSGTFDNFCQSDQTAPTANTITYGTQLGFTGTLPGTIYRCADGTRFDGPIVYVDSAYHMNLDPIPHTRDSVVIEFFASGSGWQGGDDESWAIDNVEVSVISPPLYSICLLYDPAKAAQSGSTIPIKLQLCDSSGANLSSSSIVVHATSIAMSSSSISGTVQDSGNANPDDNFRFDSTLGGTGGYIFNLNTRGLTTGTYLLSFRAGGDTATYQTPFQVK